MVKPYNRYMGGTDMWDKLRMALFYSTEAVTHCLPQVVAEMLMGAGGRCFGEHVYLLEICRPEKQKSDEVYVVNSPSST
jgi:hypothetical protein